MICKIKIIIYSIIQLLLNGLINNFKIDLLIMILWNGFMNK